MNQLSIFFQFMRRDLHIYWHRKTRYLINFGAIYPFLFSFAYCYIIPSIFFGDAQHNPQMGTLLFIGHSLIMLIPLAFNLMVGLLFDLEHNRYIDYQITMLSPRLVLVQRILFTSLFVFIMTLPFFPLAKIYMGSLFVTNNSSWPLVFLMLYVSALCSAAYLQCMICLIPNTRTLRRFWIRVNFILITLGGLFIPWATMYQFWPLLGKLTLFNPLIYMTEGLRNAILSDTQFISAYYCIGALLLFSFIFTLLSFYFFKRRVDHI